MARMFPHQILDPAHIGRIESPRRRRPGAELEVKAFKESGSEEYELVPWPHTFNLTAGLDGWGRRQRIDPSERFPNLSIGELDLGIAAGKGERGYRGLQFSPDAGMPCTGFGWARGAGKRAVERELQRFAATLFERGRARERVASVYCARDSDEQKQCEN
ncbi:hypothetical protein [Reyranella sp.]|uniref:hypothetical protein n=1 Tax=Reyranella sp. TaxID=1929291 RepID=UPI003BADB515